MRPLAVVVVDVVAEHAFEVTPVEDQQPVQAFGAHGADEALRDRVRPGRPHRRLYLLSRSRIRKRTSCSAKSRPRLRACWVTQGPVGLVVQPASQTRRLAWAMKKST
jgi:hypothetical protein